MLPKAKDLTVEEKFRMLVGWARWNINDLDGKLPSFSMNDGPHGWRTGEPAHAYPTVSALASSWDAGVTAAVADAICDEFIEHKVDMILAPGVNIKRNPLCGRNFEYVSEDPLLAGDMGRAYIEACEKRGVCTSLKHYCANNQETYRRAQSSDVDERALYEIYLRPFQLALEAKPASVMCSYNPINGIYASENRHLLKDVLRDEFGFDGVIVSDWAAVQNRARALKATLDLQMPFKQSGIDELKKAYESGFITDAEIDESVDRLLALIQKAQDNHAVRKVKYSEEQRFSIAAKAAEDCFVLLKNDGGLLPLKKGSSVLVCGDMGYRAAWGGGGSSLVFPKVFPKPLNEELEATGFFSRVDSLYVPQKTPSNILENVSSQIVHELRSTTLTKTYLADDCDVALVCVGNSFLTERESKDRETLRLRKVEEDLICNMAKKHDKVAVLLYAGAPVDVSAWIDCVDALLLVGYAGEGVHAALAKTLTGASVPSGKLAETWPISLEDTYCGDDFGDGFAGFYGDHVFVGYRYYDGGDIPVAFPFGYGMSYASFRYDNLRVTKHGETDYTVQYDITNDSDFDAQEVSQLYVADHVSSVVRPPKELKGYSKDLIPAHGTKTVTLTLDRSAFAFFNVNLHAWYVENGRFDILVGPSGADLPLRARIDIRLPEETQYSVYNVE